MEGAPATDGKTAMADVVVFVQSMFMPRLPKGRMDDQVPSIKRTPEAGQEFKRNVVAGRLFAWLQHAVVSIGELLGSKADGCMETIAHGTFQHMLEASRRA